MSKKLEQAMKFHEEAMDFSGKAQVAQIKGEEVEALVFFKEAFKLEKEAAMLLENEKVKLITRAVLFRSAAVLALDCGKISEAEKLIDLGLSGKVPPQIADELQDLKEDVEFERREELRKTKLGSGFIKLQPKFDHYGESTS